MVDISALGGQSPSLTNSQQGLATNFDMFLTLLTEQMKNQDPLDPLDSTQFVNQLVDFSSVEQQIAQNQNLESLLLLQSAAAQSSSVSYIGRVASATTPDVAMENGTAEWTYFMPEDSKNTTLVVRDSEGRIINRVDGETSTGEHTFSWDGKDPAGAQMADGVYSLEILAIDNNNATIAPYIQSSGRVTGVDLSGSEVVIEMGAVRVPLSSVLSLKEEAST
jgi:flagellar basal-body rod modification protein FlgD